jgi:CRP-like cAMP-binding protein
LPDTGQDVTLAIIARARAMKPVLKYCFGLPEVAMDAGTVLISEGERQSALYILVSGSVEIMREGLEVARCDLPGAIFGEVSALLDQPHAATVRAASDVRVHIIENPNQFLTSRPEIAFQVAALLARRLDATTAYLVTVLREHAGAGAALDQVEKVVTEIAHSQAGPTSAN